MSGPEEIRVSEALGGESTEEVGSDATNDASDHAMSTGEARMVEEGVAVSAPAGENQELKEVTLRTAPQDPRFPTTNQSRRCYVAYNEYHKCIKERGEGSGDCRPYMRAYRSLCPDEWIENWKELRENGAWYGKY